jgi:hypothetical protein
MVSPTVWMPENWGTDHRRRKAHARRDVPMKLMNGMPTAPMKFF